VSDPTKRVAEAGWQSVSLGQACGRLKRSICGSSVYADPASHPYQFARWHVLAIVEMLAYRDRVPDTCDLAYCDCSRIETMPVYWRLRQIAQSVSIRVTSEELSSAIFRGLPWTILGRRGALFSGIRRLAGERMFPVPDSSAQVLVLLSVSTAALPPHLSMTGSSCMTPMGNIGRALWDRS